MMWSWQEDQCKNMVKSGKFECPDFMRVCGEMVCEQCGRQYYDHPQNIPFHFLHMLCDGRHVKL